MINFGGGMPVLLIAIAVIFLIMIFRTATMHRQHMLDTDQRMCRGCGARHPTYAMFCRRCGRRL
jgi:ribosomal protein L40E